MHHALEREVLTRTPRIAGVEAGARDAETIRDDEDGGREGRGGPGKPVGQRDPEGREEKPRGNEPEKVHERGVRASGLAQLADELRHVAVARSEGAAENDERHEQDRTRQASQREKSHLEPPLHAACVPLHARSCALQYDGSAMTGLRARQPRHLGQVWVHVIPWLSTHREDVLAGPELPWIVQAAGSNRHHVRPGTRFTEER